MRKYLPILIANQLPPVLGLFAIGEIRAAIIRPLAQRFTRQCLDRLRPAREPAIGRQTSPRLPI